ncbi:hypothetical protein DXG01_001902 [Tephrocybe rancida]|nr:hypothetical protein DXG01_001902 [Tephrocybe rancida]
MRDKQEVERYKADIKGQLTRAGLIRQPRTSQIYQNSSSTLSSQIRSHPYHRSSAPEISTSSSLHFDHPDYGYRYVNTPHEQYSHRRSEHKHVPNMSGPLYTDSSMNTLGLQSPFFYPQSMSSSPSPIDTDLPIDFSNIGPSQEPAGFELDLRPPSPLSPASVSSNESHSSVTMSDDWPIAESMQSIPTAISEGQEMEVSAQYITCNLAQSHLVSHHLIFHQKLVEWNYTGPYSLHCGFNQATIHYQQPEQQIYIVLDAEVSDGLRNALKEVACPFPGIVMTPVSILLEEGMHGTEDEIPGLLSVPTESTDGGDSEGNESQGSSSNEKGKSRDDGEGHGTGRGDNHTGNGGGDGDGDGSRGKSNIDRNGSGDGGDGDDEDDTRKDDDRQATRDDGSGGVKPGSVQIPFSSTLVTEDCKEKFEISCHVSALVNDQGDRSWDPPLLEIEMNRLQIQSETHTNKYFLSTCQVQIMASGCPLTVIDWLPGVVQAEDSSKYREERNLAGTASMTLSATPGLRFDGKFGSLQGTERNQQPWIIRSTQVNGIDDDSDSEGILWKYDRNLKGFPPVEVERFAARPMLSFGLDDVIPMALPKLEVQVVIFWSFEKAKLLSSSSWRAKSKDGLPANLNFLHRMSMVVDLRYLQPGRSFSVIKGNVKDKVPPLAVNGDFKDFNTHGPLRLSSSSQSSNLKVFIKQALEGRIGGLTRGENSGSDLFKAWGKQTSAALPTPKPSPRHTPI